MMTEKRVSVSQIANLKSSGMCYVIDLKNGEFIIIDGGEDDLYGKEFYDFNSKALKNHLQKSANGQKIVIAAWIITHFHLDHVDLATKFLRQERENIEVKLFAYNSPGEYESCDESRRLKLFCQAMELYPMAKKQLLKTGDVLEFCGVTLDVLMAEDFRYHKVPPSQNHICAALMANFDGGRRFAIFGDCDTERLHQMRVEGSMVYQEADKLVCDILQVPHHGLPLGSLEFVNKNLELYKIMEPKICLFPVDNERYETDAKFFNNPSYSDNYYLLTTRKENCYPADETVTVYLDDLSVTYE